MDAPSKSDRFRLSDQYQALKQSLHRYLIDQIEQQNLDIESWSADKTERYIGEALRRYVMEQRLPISRNEVDALTQDARDELIGLGPIQQLVDDDTIDDIVVNGPDSVYVERQGRLQKVPLRFNDDNHVVRVIQRILSPLGRRIDESTPMVDARLADGSRVNAIIPPIALNGPCVSIRKFRAAPLTDADLIRLGSITEDELNYLKSRVQGRTNILVTGGTGSGKTTFLNMLSQWIPATERIITIEDAAELRLRNDHVVRLETRPPNLEGQRAISTRDLIRNALRMRPDRVIVGEVRGDEVLDMLQAMNTGHDGSMTTLHANSPGDAIHRLELLAGFAGYTGNEITLRSQIESALQLIVHVSRLASGKRRVLSISELVGLQGRDLKMKELFRYEPENDRHLDLRVAA